MSRTVAEKKKKAKVNKAVAGVRQIAGKFKAKGLAIMRKVNETGRPAVVTKRGAPVVKVVAIRNKSDKTDDFIGRLESVMKIVGDPDDLIKPVFPLEDYVMLK